MVSELVSTELEDKESLDERCHIEGDDFTIHDIKNSSNRPCSSFGRPQAPSSYSWALLQCSSFCVSEIYERSVSSQIRHPANVTGKQVICKGWAGDETVSTKKYTSHYHSLCNGGNFPCIAVALGDHTS